jgi:chromosome segregation ATPase
MRLSVRQLEKESENTQTTRTQTTELVAALDEMITKNACLRDQINDFSDALTVTKRDLHDISGSVWRLEKRSEDSDVWRTSVSAWRTSVSATVRELETFNDDTGAWKTSVSATVHGLEKFNDVTNAWKASVSATVHELEKFKGDTNAWRTSVSATVCELEKFNDDTNSWKTTMSTAVHELEQCYNDTDAWRTSVSATVHQLEKFNDDTNAWKSSMSETCVELAKRKDKPSDSEQQQLPQGIMQHVDKALAGQTDAISQHVKNMLQTDMESLVIAEVRDILEAVGSCKQDLKTVGKTLDTRDTGYASTFDSLKESVVTLEQLMSDRLQQNRTAHELDREELREELDALLTSVAEIKGRGLKLDIPSEISDESKKNQTMMAVFRGELVSIRSVVNENRQELREGLQALHTAVEEIKGCGPQLDIPCDGADENKKTHTMLAKFRGELVALRTMVDESQKCMSEFEQSNKSMKLVWTTAHTALTEDMRELMARFNEATPLKLADQLKELREDLDSELRNRNCSTQKPAMGKSQLPNANLATSGSRRISLAEISCTDVAGVEQGPFPSVLAGSSPTHMSRTISKEKQSLSRARTPTSPRQTVHLVRSSTPMENVQVRSSTPMENMHGSRSSSKGPSAWVSPPSPATVSRLVEQTAPAESRQSSFVRGIGEFVDDSRQSSFVRGVGTSVPSSPLFVSSGDVTPPQNHGRTDSASFVCLA